MMMILIVIWPNHGVVMQNEIKRLSPRLEDKLTLATEEGTKLVQQFILLWRSTKTDMRMSMVK